MRLFSRHYIDESYADYMTYFYEGGIALNDKIFIRSITDMKAKPYSYILTDPKSVVDWLRLETFDQPEVLNFALMEYLLCDLNYQAYLVRLLEQLERNRNFEFIKQYYAENYPHRAKFVQCLNHQWPEAFAELQQNNVFSDAQLHRFVIDTLCNASEEDLRRINVHGDLCKYIKSNNTFLTILNPDVEQLIKSFGVLDVRFPYAVLEKASDDLLWAIYVQSQYEITFENIGLMYSRFVEEIATEELQHSCYSLLRRNPETPLSQYVEDNIGLFVDIVLNESDKKITDEPSVALQLINNTAVTLDSAKKYCQYFVGTFEKLSDIKQMKLWPELLSNGKIKFSVENIGRYYKQNKKMDRSLIKYLNDFSTEFQFEGLSEELGDNANQFFEAVIQCGELKNAIYSALLLELKDKGHFEPFTYKKIPDGKMAILIKSGIVQMSQETLLFIRNNYGSMQKTYIIRNQKQYIAIMSDNLFDFDEMRMLLLQAAISDQTKVQLLSYTNRTMSIQGKAYSDAVIVHILEHNFDKADLMPIAESYSEYSDAVRNAFLPRAIENLASILDNSQNVSGVLLDDLMKSSDFTPTNQIELLAAMCKWIDIDEVRSRLYALDLEVFIPTLEPNKRPTVPRNKANKLLLDAFKENGWISSYKTDPQDTECYRVMTRRKKLKETAENSV